MGRTILIPTRFTGPWARAAAIILAGGVFASAASLVGPDATEATPIGASREQADRALAESMAQARAARLPAFLGSLTSSSYHVDVFVGRHGPLYTIKSLDGRVLGELLPSDEVYARFPDLGPRELQAGTHATADEAGR